MDRDGRRTDWHHTAFVGHITRVPDDFPEPESDAWWIFFEAWSEALDELAVTEAEFEAASKEVSRDPPSHPNKHLRALIEAIRKARRSDQSVSKDRERAERASRDCPHCGGSGLASRDHCHPERGRYTVIYICICPLGRWIHDQHARDPNAPRLRDLADFPELCSDAREDDPRHVRLAQLFFEDRARTRASTSADHQQTRPGPLFSPPTPEDPSDASPPPTE